MLRIDSRKQKTEARRTVREYVIGLFSIFHSIPVIYFICVLLSCDFAIYSFRASSIYFITTLLLNMASDLLCPVECQWT